MQIYNVKIEQHNIELQPGEEAIIEKFKTGLMTVTQLCEELGKYGLQVVRITETFIRLQMDVGENYEITVSFEVEL